jgi:rapamycin-insensitive companion of mTOR
MQQTQNHETLALKLPDRTCFFILGLISSTSQGAELLDDYHWEATLSPLGQPTGLCIPMDLEKFLFVSGNQASNIHVVMLIGNRQLPPWTQHTPDAVEMTLVAPASDPERDVIAAIHNLANTVIANTASRSLAKYVHHRVQAGLMSIEPSSFFETE